MPEQEPIPPPPASGPGPELGPKSTSTGLPSNVAAALACIPLIGGIIFYIVEKHDSFVRFYAMQSIIFGGAWLLFNIVSRILFLILWSIPARIVMIAITTSNSMRVKPRSVGGGELLDMDFVVRSA